MKPFATAACTALVLFSAAAAADMPPDFSGEWTATKASVTDAAPSNPRDAAQGHAGGMGGRHSGMGSRHRGSQRGATRGDSPAAGAGDAFPRLHAKTLTIRQSEVVFDVAADGGSRMVYRFDNRNNYGPAYGGTVSLNWSPPEMVIETHPDAGGSIEERYSLSADARRLTLKIHALAAGAESARDVTRVFSRDGDGGAAALP